MALKKLMSGGTMFMQGKYMSLAIGDDGALGTTNATPLGFDSYKIGEVTNLGMYVDLDGFGAGKASTLQDVAAMGAVIERFNIGYKINGAQHVEGNTQFGTSTIHGSSSDLSDASAAKAGWTGVTDEKLKVDQVVTLTEDSKYVRVDIKLTNQSAETMADVRYMRTIDPDQDKSYKNNIKILEQGNDGADGALIAAYTTGNTNPFFYYTADDRAKVSTYNMLNRDPYAAAAWNSAQAEGYGVNSVDQAVNITFAAGNLAAGQSTTLTFYMGVTDDLSATLAEIKAAAPVISRPTPINTAPVAEGDAVDALFNEAVVGNVLTNDSDPEGSALTASLVSGPTNGTVKLAADGTFTYTPNAGFSGKDAFIYSASDGSNRTPAKVTVNVAGPPNAAPDAVADAATVQSGQSVVGNVLANDKDANGDSLTASLLSGPTNGTVSLDANGRFVYTAKAGFVGTDSFTYAATDGKASDQAQVTVSVTAPPNAAPDAVADAATVQSGQSVVGNVLANDKDANGDSLTASLLSGPTNGTVSLDANGRFVYTAKAGFVGTDSFTYAATDGKASDQAQVTVSVTAPPNAAPDAVADAATVQSGQSVVGNVLANDKDANGDSLTASLLSGPTNGTVSLDANGRFVYTAKAGFVGTDSFTYAATDGKASDQAQVTVSVTAPQVSVTPLQAFLDEHHAVDGSATTSDSLTGRVGHNAFYFDREARSGVDKIENFERSDLLVFSSKLPDSNNDGVISWSRDTLRIDGSPTGDSLKVAGVASLRYMGEAVDGAHVYANASVRPKGALESTLADNNLSGDKTDKKGQKFFFDTALGLDLGSDTVRHMGAKDVLVTTTALADADRDGIVDFDNNGLLALIGADGQSLGHVAISDIKGTTISGLELDSFVEHNGTHYYVYSLIDSMIGSAAIGF